jgi:hypothetical protein
MSKWKHHLKISPKEEKCGSKRRRHKARKKQTCIVG